MPPITRAEAERRALEELVARVASRAPARPGRAPGRSGSGSGSGGGAGGAHLARRLARPERAEHDRDHDADPAEEPRADDQADEQARPRRRRSRAARCSELGCCACRPRVGFHACSIPSLYRAGFNLPAVRTVNDVSLDATTGTMTHRAAVALAIPYSAQRRVDERAHLVAHLDLLAATAARPPPGPCASRRARACRRTHWSVGAWSSWSSGPSVRTTSRFGSTFAQTRKKTSA